ncbi:MAG: enoyl-CoA hydratase/isomerase family protein [Deltaproteobacteria bacterium]|nr:enoyl-CoA hydratase/isomerase family protein [Deltaproteobacteria bacterium]
MNAMTVAMKRRMARELAGLGEDPAVRVVLVRGAGDKAFSAGGDVAEFLELAPHELAGWGDECTAPERCPKPVIAAIDGYAMGAGLELALACDFRLATTRSQFAFPEVRLGMIPGSGGTQRVLRLIGLTRAKAFLMTGQRISAEQAETWGLITAAVPLEGFEQAVGELARGLAAAPPLALKTLKTVLMRGMDAPLEAGLELERKAYAWLRTTRDYEEGVKAFLQKRPPRFTGT